MSYFELEMFCVVSESGISRIQKGCPMVKSRRRAGTCALAAVAVASLISACGERNGADAAVVHTTSGAVRGAVFANHLLFQGIPFAQPPVGERRWQPPLPAAAWAGERAADKKPGSLCMQNPADPSTGTQSEDCLYLNVTTPVSKPSRSRPVLVWLHGGGFYQGNAAEYGAARLASRGDVVVITANYRLGVFGFLRMPGMVDGGVFGLQDQQMALRWTRDNAAAFGGDPGNITLFGESAGAMSACAQLTSPGARGLFHKAVLQSGTCMVEWPPYDADGSGYSPFEAPAVAERHGDDFATSLGCRDLTCLRRTPTERLLPGMARFTPSYGNSVLPKHPAIALRDGRFPRIPLIVGTTGDEARMSIAGSVPAPLTPDGYRRALDADFGAYADAVAAVYPAEPGDNSLTLARLGTDRTWAYTTRIARDTLAQSTTVYGYEFADPAPPTFVGMPAASFPYGAFHGSELAYLFEMGGLAENLDEPRRALSDAMIRYWSAFAHTGAPAGSGLPTWAPIGGKASRQHVQSLAPGSGGIAPIDFDTTHHIDFWARHAHR